MIIFNLCNNNHPVRFCHIDWIMDTLYCHIFLSYHWISFYSHFFPLHMLTHTHSCMHTHACAHSFSLSLSLSNTHVQTFICIHICLKIYPQICTCVHTHSQIYIYTHTAQLLVQHWHMNKGIHMQIHKSARSQLSNNSHCTITFFFWFLNLCP